MRRFFILLLLWTLPLCAQAKEKVCLNMIVKNESKVIRRCLDSVKPLIDYWVIVDTGSTDGTQEIIKKHLKGIPGELHERKWRNFGENRTEAFELAKGKGDYILFMDADDTLEFEAKCAFPPLTYDLYNMWRGTKSFSYHKPQLVRGDLPWKWVGVTHEYLGCDQPYSSTILTGVKYRSGDGGASTYDPKKFLKNIKLLLAGLKKEPGNSRYVFYLAESYRDAGMKGRALEWFQKRVTMGGWNEEVFISLLQIGHMLHDIGLPESMVIDAYKRAHQFRIHRAEPLYYLAEIYNRTGNYSRAYEYLKAWEFIPKPAERDWLFNEDWIEQYGMLFQLSISAYYMGHYQEALNACDKLLTIEDLPESWKELTKQNRTYPLAKLKEKTVKPSSSVD
jgi:glycosyltransferase involved in cell wall biosynthesis